MALPVGDNPPELFLGSASLVRRAGSGEVSSEIFGPCPWAAARVGSQKEKAFARWLKTCDYPYFLPVVKSVTPGTRNTVLLPMFDGIVFFQAHTEPVKEGYIIGGLTPREYEVRRHRYVWDVQKTGHQRLLKRELAALVTECRSGERPRRETSMPDGEKVMVIAGPWANREGKVVEPHPERPLVAFFLEGLREFHSFHIDANHLVKVQHEEPTPCTRLS